MFKFKLFAVLAAMVLFQSVALGESTEHSKSLRVHFEEDIVPDAEPLTSTVEFQDSIEDDIVALDEEVDGRVLQFFYYYYYDYDFDFDFNYNDKSAKLFTFTTATFAISIVVLVCVCCSCCLYLCGTVSLAAYLKENPKKPDVEAMQVAPEGATKVEPTDSL